MISLAFMGILNIMHSLKSIELLSMYLDEFL